MKSFILILLTVAGISASAQQVANVPTDMHPYTSNGFELTGAEYWVFTAEKEFAYPDDVLWGFLGERKNDGTPGQAPELTKVCAVKAYNKLNQFYANPPAGMRKLIDSGKVTKRFFLWTNDYTKASATEEVRPNNLWHWNRGPKDYSLGYWKWESTVTRAGECLIPDDTQIQSRIEEITKILGL
ncbi:MAG: hypothetical protein V4736_16505 [Bdellovibrionota bacterium]